MPRLPFCNCIIAESGGRCQRRPEEVRKPWTSEKPDKQTKEYAQEKHELCRIDKNDENVITGRQLKCRIIIMRRNRKGASDLPLLRGNKRLAASEAQSEKEAGRKQTKRPSANAESLFLESLNTFEAPSFKSAPKTKAKASAAGSIWKRGAAE